MLPSDSPLLGVWSDGYLTAREGTKRRWTAKTLEKKGRAVRRLLEHATDGQIDRDRFVALPDWLARRLEGQGG
ncbi:hypothetical protein [Jannaschia formosa]|uniref:hypothetical protein n=1 Tax=Jannaschia formosa TaxID=2259592 RepID=UPI001FD86E16|nr:hypothetical protein [Jannaschia formosa]